MLKLLVPVDGSEVTQRLADYLVRLRDRRVAVEIHLLNVQIPVESGHARMFVSAEDIDRYHREQAREALASAQTVLDAEGISHQDHVVVGHVAPAISNFAAEQGFDGVVMGTHGRSGLSGLLLGSVTREVINSSKVPVTIVK